MTEKVKMPETMKAIESLRQTAPEALDTSPRPPNADGTPTTNDEIIAIKLEFIVQDVEELISDHLTTNHAGRCVTVQFSDLDHPDPKRREEMVEEMELYSKHFTPHWLWDMSEHKHVRVLPDDPDIGSLDFSTFESVPFLFDEIVFVENRVMGPIPNVDEFLKKIEEEDKAREAAKAGG